jgi:general secretion pathway protein C
VNDNRRMVSRFAAFVTWAAIAASVVFWSLRLWVRPTAVPTHATLISNANAFNGDLTRLFGPDPTADSVAAAPAVPAQVDARFKLIGVVAPRAATAKAEGLALIAMDGKAPRAYRVGTAVDGDMVLLAVHSRGATLGPRGQAAMVDLQLPALPPPATGAPTAMGAAAQTMRALPALPNRPGLAPTPPPTEPPVVAQPETAGRPADETAPERPPTVPQMSPGRARQPM